jgi:hypothetical protein
VCHSCALHVLKMRATATSGRCRQFQGTGSFFLLLSTKMLPSRTSHRSPVMTVEVPHTQYTLLSHWPTLCYRPAQTLHAVTL